VYFIAGVYGVGKSTLCGSLANNLKIPFYSAGDLISEVNGETYGSNKLVKNKNRNQNILIDAVNNKLKNDNTFLLAGHFCIFDNNHQVDYIPVDVFRFLHIKGIVLLESDLQVIVSNLTHRDNTIYSADSMCLLKQSEREQAYNVASILDVPLIVHEMKYTEADIEEISSFLTDRCF